MEPEPTAPTEPAEPAEQNETLMHLARKLKFVHIAEEVDYEYDDNLCLWVKINLYKEVVKLLKNVRVEQLTVSKKAKEQRLNIDYVVEQVALDNEIDSSSMDPRELLPFDFNGPSVFDAKSWKIRTRRQLDYCTESISLPKLTAGSLQAFEAMMKRLYSPAQVTWIASALFDFLLNETAYRTYMFDCPFPFEMVNAMSELAIGDRLVSHVAVKAKGSKVLYIMPDAALFQDSVKISIFLPDPSCGEFSPTDEEKESINRSTVFIWMLSHAEPFANNPFPEVRKSKIPQLRRRLKIEATDAAVSKIILDDEKADEDVIAKKMDVPPDVVSASLKRLCARFL